MATTTRRPGPWLRDAGKHDVRAHAAGFNGDWVPWLAMRNPNGFRLANHQFVQTSRAVSTRLVFTWAPNVGKRGMDPAADYASDDVVDIIGTDCYWQPHDLAHAADA